MSISVFISGCNFFFFFFFFWNVRDLFYLLLFSLTIIILLETGGGKGRGGHGASNICIVHIYMHMDALLLPISQPRYLPIHICL